MSHAGLPTDLSWWLHGGTRNCLRGQRKKTTVMYGLYVTMWIIVLTYRKSSINGDFIRNIFHNWRFFNGSTMDYLTLRWFFVRAKNPGHF